MFLESDQITIKIGSPPQKLSDHCTAKRYSLYLYLRLYYQLFLQEYVKLILSYDLHEQLLSPKRHRQTITPLI